MQIKLQNRIINAFTFLIHLALSFFLMGLGYISRNGLWGRPAPEDITIGNIAIILSLILLGTSILMLIKRNIYTYIISVLMALVSMISWIIVEKSTDMELLLFAYLIVFAPLAFYKYRLSKP